MSRASGPGPRPPRHPSRGHTWNHRSNKKLGAAVHPGSRPAPRHPTKKDCARSPKGRTKGEWRQRKSPASICQPGQYWDTPRSRATINLIRLSRRGCDAGQMEGKRLPASLSKVVDHLRHHTGRSSEEQTVKPNHVDRVEYGHANERGNRHPHFCLPNGGDKNIN